jgi:hypothetical protein
VASAKGGDGSAPLRSASRLFITAPNSDAVFLNTFSVSAGVVSRALVLEGRDEMSMGVRFMGFTLQRMFEDRVAVAEQRQNMAADQLLVSYSNLRTSFVVWMQKMADQSGLVWHATCFKVLKNPHPIALFDFTPS